MQITVLTEHCTNLLGFKCIRFSFNQDFAGDSRNLFGRKLYYFFLQLNAWDEA
jgi:hypothetical protein